MTLEKKFYSFFADSKNSCIFALEFITLLA